MNFFEILKQGGVYELADMLAVISDEMKNDSKLPSDYVSDADLFYKQCIRHSISVQELLGGSPLIVGTKYGLSFIIANQILAIDQQKEAHKPLINDLLENILDYSPEIKRGLSKAKISELLKLVDKLGFLDVINNYQNRLKILCIPHIHKNYNSLYGEGTNCILSSVRHKEWESGSPEYIFLHEIGHALLYHITDGAKILPRDFGPIIIEGFSKGILEDAPFSTFKEVYCDCFTVAVCEQHDELRKINPFSSVFHPKLKSMIEEYFQNEAKRFTHNYPIHHPMEEFFKGQKLV